MVQDPQGSPDPTLRTTALRNWSLASSFPRSSTRPVPGERALIPGRLCSFCARGESADPGHTRSHVPGPERHRGRCPDLGIGKNGELPWPRLNNEFKHFRRLTSTSSEPGRQNVVLMGRKTWFSIPEKNRPLNNRINIVLSRELTAPPPGAHHLCSDFSSALDLIRTQLDQTVDQVWVIGGSSLYKELLQTSGLKRLFVTRILQQFDCDTFLPQISLDQYKLLPQFPGVSSELQEENGVQYKYEVYESLDSN
ncbi:hypothetical protein WMY93_004566 [Mugilogobius chulae]|uniref:Dihydrofolate reductase n=1 Tax=Mugilogobius chulae TaxID=88201 RepID=A0AAW0PNW9_9GOBI